jgi:hypothetical protein
MAQPSRPGARESVDVSLVVQCNRERVTYRSRVVVVLVVTGHGRGSSRGRKGQGINPHHAGQRVLLSANDGCC